MKIWKIVSGILSIVISLFVVFQSFFAGAYNIITGNGQSSGTAGVLVAIMLFVAGIIAIVTHNGSRGGDIALAVLYGIGTLVGFFCAGNYTDLYIWAIWCLLCTFLALLDFALLGRELDDEEDEEIYTVQTAAPAAKAPATFRDVILETDPRRRDAAIDALPEKQAKNYLKQALNVLVPRQAVRSSSEEGGGLIKALAAILVLLGIFLVVVVCIGIFAPVSGGEGAPNSANPDSSQAVPAVSSTQESTSEPQTDEPDVSPTSGSGNLGNYYVEIKSAIVVEDYDGNPTVMVTYEWTNNSEDTTSAMAAFSEKAFQNGVQLDRALVYSNDVPGYDPNASTRNLRPGASTEVQCVFSLPDTESAVEFELSELIRFSDDIVMEYFELTSPDTAT